jgi:hypothetical protein
MTNYTSSLLHRPHLDPTTPFCQVASWVKGAVSPYRTSFVLPSMWLQERHACPTRVHRCAPSLAYPKTINIRRGSSPKTSNELSHVMGTFPIEYPQGAGLRSRLSDQVHTIYYSSMQEDTSASRPLRLQHASLWSSTSVSQRHRRTSAT